MILLFFLLTCPLIAQDQITINLNNRSISTSTTISVQELKKTRENLLNNRDYLYMKFDTSYRCYYHHLWGDGNDVRDTFFYVDTEIARKKNIIELSPILYDRSYQLDKQLAGKSWYKKDSILNATMQEIYKWKPLPGYIKITYKVTPIKYYQEKYPYIDIYSTCKTIKKKGEKTWYDSRATRVFVIGEIFYYIDVRDNDIKYSKSILRSRKAVCCDFKRLVNNIKIIEAEEGRGGT